MASDNEFFKKMVTSLKERSEKLKKVNTKLYELIKTNVKGKTDE